MTVRGLFVAQFFASSDVADTDWAVRVCDVYPDGRSINLADGAVNAKMWSGDSDPKPLVPGTVYEYRLELQKTAVTLKRGHTLRLDVASAAEGFLLTNSNTLEGFDGTDPRKASQRIYAGPDYPATLSFALDAQQDSN